jgi:hypothetical protein
MHIHLVIMPHGKIYESLTSHPVAIHTMNEKNIAREFFKKDDRQPNKIPCRRTEVLRYYRSTGHPPTGRAQSRPVGGRQAKQGTRAAKREHGEARCLSGI